MGIEKLKRVRTLQAIAFRKKTDLHMYIYASVCEIFGWFSNRTERSNNYGRPCQIVKVLFQLILIIIDIVFVLGAFVKWCFHSLAKSTYYLCTAAELMSWAEKNAQQ